MKMTDFAEMVSNYLTKELPIVRNVSPNTIISYRDTYVLLIKFFNEVFRIKAEHLKMKDITPENICTFLSWLENERNNSINTRNQRLAAIHAFVRYVQTKLPEYMFQCQKVLAIPYKKTQRKLVGYLTEENTALLLGAPDVNSKKGRRDQTLLCLLYDSGARVQELADLKVSCLRLETPAQITITGKGQKTRSVPLMKKTVLLLRNYLKEYRLDLPTKYDHPLFFNSRGENLTRQGIAYILKKYAEYCHIEKISPHLIRHTKAMHLTEADINPVFIRDFLGHTDLKVTQIYSKTSVKMKKQALEKLDHHQTPLPNVKTKDWSDDNDLMEWLNSLGR